MLSTSTDKLWHTDSVWLTLIIKTSCFNFFLFILTLEHNLVKLLFCFIHELVFLICCNIFWIANNIFLISYSLKSMSQFFISSVRKHCRALLSSPVSGNKQKKLSSELNTDQKMSKNNPLYFVLVAIVVFS